MKYSEIKKIRTQEMGVIRDTDNRVSSSSSGVNCIPRCQKCGNGGKFKILFFSLILIVFTLYFILFMNFFFLILFNDFFIFIF